MNKDYEIFFEEIEPNSKIIEVGCGSGDFLSKLKSEKNCHCTGIEIESERVSKALEKGLSVIQGDADGDLQNYPDKDNIENSFDYLILANSLQVMKKPHEILKESRRISKKTLVSIPNFGYFKNRLYLGFKGKMPVTSRLSFEWYETPNIHFSTIRDFIDLAEETGFKVEKSYYIKGREEKTQAIKFNKSSPQIANLLGHSGVFVLS